MRTTRDLQILLGFLIISSLGACQPNNRPMRIAFYKSVDATCFSTDGTGFNLYPEYTHREQIIIRSHKEIAKLVEAFRKAGFFEDTDPPDPVFISIPPCPYPIRILADGQVKMISFSYHEAGRIPGKYLDIMESIPKEYKTKLIETIIAENRYLAPMKSSSPPRQTPTP